MNKDLAIQMVVTVLCAVLASSGFWAYLQRKHDRKDDRTALLIGLAHDRIMELGMRYIERGYITRDEYENLYKYLYKPYERNGGNGSAKRIMQEVDKLSIRNVDALFEEIVGTITAVDTFLGVLLGISSVQYNRGRETQ